jgi:hypothetical protein
MLSVFKLCAVRWQDGQWMMNWKGHDTEFLNEIIMYTALVNVKLYYGCMEPMDIICPISYLSEERNDNHGSSHRTNNEWKEIISPPLPYLSVLGSVFFVKKEKGARTHILLIFH